jgi:hypothetical protein
MKAGRWWIALCVLFSAAAVARADAVLFLSEPYGSFGKMNPTGHSAVYLTRVCADSPTKLRRCQPGELGAVVSRYHKISGYDWIAIPLIPYLYAVDDLQQVPESADRAAVDLMRDRYRCRHLLEIVPDADAKDAPNWTQLIGSAYDRRIYALKIETSEAQDDQLIELLNSLDNRSRFNILFRNCADFSRWILNSYYPKAVRRSITADVGITTPKQVAKSLVAYGRKNPDLALSRWIIEQVPGSRPISKPARGILESIVRSKKYVVPLAVFQPVVTGGVAAGYVLRGRFNPKQEAIALRPTDLGLDKRGIEEGPLGDRSAASLP